MARPAAGGQLPRHRWLLTSAENPWSAISGLLVPSFRIFWLFKNSRGIGGGLRPALHAQLGEQRGNIVFDGFFRQEHLLPDLPVRQPFADQLTTPPLLLG